MKPFYDNCYLPYQTAFGDFTHGVMLGFFSLSPHLLHLSKKVIRVTLTTGSLEHSLLLGLGNFAVGPLTAASPPVPLDARHFLGELEALRTNHVKVDLANQVSQRGRGRFQALSEPVTEKGYSLV